MLRIRSNQLKDTPSWIITMCYYHTVYDAAHIFAQNSECAPQSPSQWACAMACKHRIETCSFVSIIGEHCLARVVCMHVHAPTLQEELSWINIMVDLNLNIDKVINEPGALTKPTRNTNYTTIRIDIFYTAFLIIRNNQFIDSWE